MYDRRKTPVLFDAFALVVLVFARAKGWIDGGWFGAIFTTVIGLRAGFSSGKAKAWAESVRAVPSRERCKECPWRGNEEGYEGPTSTDRPPPPPTSAVVAVAELARRAPGALFALALLFVLVIAWK